MRDRILKRLARLHVTHPWRMLFIALAITLGLAVLAGGLRVSTRTADLLPSGDPKVEQFNRIIDEFATATSLVVVVQGEEGRVKEFADCLAPLILEARDTSQNDIFQGQIKKLLARKEKLERKGNKKSKMAAIESEIETFRSRINYRLFQRVDYKEGIDFLRDHMLMLVKEEDLENIKQIFTDPHLSGFVRNINSALEKEYVSQEESLSTREKEDGAVAFLDGIESFILQVQKSAKGEKVEDKKIRAAAEKFLFGEPYFLSYDRSALIMNVIPNFTLMDRDYIMTGTKVAQALVDDLLKKFPDVQAGLSGAIAKEHDEQVYSARSLSYTTLIALVAILILLIFSFKMWAAPVLAVLSLMVGLIWAMGSAFLVVGQLNLVTSTMAIIILGLGIDFSIHLISAFTERRAAGESISSAMEDTFLKSGKGIVTGAVTTSCAFYALVISHSRGMKEMGLVMGTGLLAILLATFFFLPILLVFRAGLKEKKSERKGFVFPERDISFRFLGRTANWLGQHHTMTIAVSSVLTAFLVWAALRIGWDYDYRKMEPEGLISMDLMDTIQEKFDLSMDYALVITDDVEESRELAKKYRELKTVALTEDISLYIPSPEQQSRRRPHLAEIREKIQATPFRRSFLPGEWPQFMEEVERLEMNIMEIQDMAYLGGQDKVDIKCQRLVGNPEEPDSLNLIRELRQLLEDEASRPAEGLVRFQLIFGPHFKETVLRASLSEAIRLKELPEFILDRYSNKTRDQFLITVYPVGSIYDGTYLKRFVNDVERVSEKATGTPPLFIAMLRIFGRDGRNAILLTLFLVFLLVWLDFRKLGHALVAMIPLVCGAFWMVGLMELAGMNFSFMSVIGLPLIIGIGIDDGVHIIHRWRAEGNGKIRKVFASTGKAIFLTSLTTMLAFGSLVFSIFPAWAQFGEALFIGVGACFLTTAIIMPGILGLMDKKGEIKISEVKKRRR